MPDTRPASQVDQNSETPPVNPYAAPPSDAMPDPFPQKDSSKGFWVPAGLAGFLTIMFCVYQSIVVIAGGEILAIRWGMPVADRQVAFNILLVVHAVLVFILGSVDSLKSERRI